MNPNSKTLNNEEVEYIPRIIFRHFTLFGFDFELRRKVWDDKVEKLEVNSIFYKYKFTAIHDPDLGFDLGQQT